MAGSNVTNLDGSQVESTIKYSTDLVSFGKSAANGNIYNIFIIH